PEQPLLTVSQLCLEVETAGGMRTLVDDVSFEIQAGQALGLVGESGSGKSLTALALLDLMPMQIKRRSGKILFDGTDLAGLSERQLRKYRGARVAYIFQDPSAALNPVMRVGAQVEEVLRAHQPQLNRQQRQKRLIELLQEVELPEPEVMARRYPHEISGGQRQRVLIAAALAGEPDLLIADEPTTALDVTVQEQILKLLERLRVERGLAMLWISHDLQLVRAFCQQTVVLYHGKVVESGTPEQLFEDPQHEHTKELVAAALAGGSATQQDQEDGSTEAPLVCKVTDLCVNYVAAGGWLGRKKIATEAVKKISFSIQPGETLALVGESGSGKTSVGRAILRLLQNVSGQVELHLANGSKIDWLQLPESAARPLRKHVSMVFQDPVAALDPRMRIWRSVAEPLTIHGQAQGAALRARALELLSDVGLDSEFADRLPGALSGGQCQRVAIARAIALQPRLVVCDEAISALDSSIQEQVLELLATLQERYGMAYLFITHDLEAVRRFAHRVAVMRQGELLEIGSTDQVLNDPQHDYTRSLLAASAAVHSAS
ncbi:MAG: ABC transporter ATP-binding protein, partial [Planctomycetes bacterium]|nr:ABC transporter ATP-binding protein [Planctomycetota bacterium]